MNYLVEQLLFLARGDSGRTTLNKQPVMTQDLMREIYEESLMIDEKHQYRLKEGGESTEVTVDPGLMKQAVRILISGINESELPHIFERFFRSDEVRSSEGTGLGLSIAKWIVDKHGGHFEVLSRKDLGTRIRIVL